MAATGRGEKGSSGRRKNTSSQGNARKKGGRSAKGGGSRTPFQHIVELVKWVDLIIEVLDARLPLSTRHPNAASIFGNKPRLIVVAKEDLADANASLSCLARLEAGTGVPCMMLSLKQKDGKARVVTAVLDATREKQESLKRKGILPRPMRICVVGLPNVGKSSLINWLIGTKRARTGDRPGITKGTQWVRVHPRLELLDTPGILPHVDFDDETESRLAMLNLLPEGRYDYEAVAAQAMDLMIECYPVLMESYIEGITSASHPLSRYAEARNMLAPGARLDLARAAALFLSELRDGRVGRITLDN